MGFRVEETDVLIVGSEAAGARAAIEACDLGAKVIVITKSVMGKSGVTLKAVFSVAAALGYGDPEDSPLEHLKDTVIGGRLLCNQKLAHIFTKEAPERILDMGKWGVPWDKASDGRYRQIKMYGHSKARSLSVGFKVGVEWISAYRREFKKREGIGVKNDVYAAELVKNSDGRVAGAVCYDIKTGEVFIIQAKAVIVATGGPLYLYGNNSGTPECTGDGIALGLRAGATVVDMEFVQFFPLGLIIPKALFGDEGITSLARTWLRAHLYNYMGERFMTRYDPEHMELADRDVLSRAVYQEIIEGRGTPNGGVWLDCSYLADKIIETVVADMAPGWKLRGIDLLGLGLDLRKEPMEVAPVVHFHCGGLSVDENWATGVPGLFACGEAVGGIHGANRLPGGAFGETQVGGVRAARKAVEEANGLSVSKLDTAVASDLQSRIETISKRTKGLKSFEIRKSIQDVMWEKVGIIRNRQGLDEALALLDKTLSEDVPGQCVEMKGNIYNRQLLEAMEVENMALVAKTICLSAAARNESRGNHYRSDHPELDNDNWLKNIYIKTAGGVQVEEKPVVVTEIPLEDLTKGK